MISGRLRAVHCHFLSGMHTCRLSGKPKKSARFCDHHVRQSLITDTLWHTVQLRYDCLQWSLQVDSMASTAHSYVLVFKGKCCKAGICLQDFVWDRSHNASRGPDLVRSTRMLDRQMLRHTFLGLLAKIKCSICSYQFNI